MINECQGVPAHLLWDCKTIDQVFPPEEKVFRRNEIPGTLEDFKSKWQFISNKIIKFNEDSYNREKYCQDPLETLYTIPQATEIDNRDQLGVIGFTVHAIEVETQDYEIDVVPDVLGYRLKMVHDPLKCNFSHSVIHIYKNEVLFEEIRPKTVKSGIRAILVDFIEMYKEVSN